jgi:hypothetical protein
MPGEPTGPRSASVHQGRMDDAQSVTKGVWNCDVFGLFIIHHQMYRITDPGCAIVNSFFAADRWFFQRTRRKYTKYTDHAAAWTAAPSASPGISGCCSPGATTAATASFRRLATATTSSTPASPARHPARRLANSSHSCGPNTRAVARVTRKVCAGCASLPVSRPARIAMHSRSKTSQRQQPPSRREQKKKRGGGEKGTHVPSMTQRSISDGGTCNVAASCAYDRSCPMFWKPRSARASRRILRSS